MRQRLNPIFIILNNGTYAVEEVRGCPCSKKQGVHDKSATPAPWYCLQQADAHLCNCR